MKLLWFEKRECTLSLAVLYIWSQSWRHVTGFVLPCSASIAYNLSPRVKGHFCVLTLIVAEYLQEMKLVWGGFLQMKRSLCSITTLLSLPIASPSLLFYLRDYAGSLQYSEINQSKQTPCLIIHDKKRVVSHNPDSFVMLSSWQLEFYYLSFFKVLVFTQWNLFMLKLYEQWIAPWGVTRIWI